MARATTKTTVTTTLRIGQVEAAVGLFSTVAKPSKLAEFDTAGPNGGVLKARPVARATPVEETAEVPFTGYSRSDPLGGGERPASDDVQITEPTFRSAPVDGEYGRELVEDGSGEVVLPENVRRGVRLEDGRFIDCTEQLADIAEKTRLERIDVVGFVDITQLPRVRATGAMYVGATEPESAKPLRLIFEAMKRQRRAAVCKVTKVSRQTLGAIGWWHGTLVFYELVFAEDFREAPARAKVIQTAEVSEVEVRAACKLVEAMSVPLTVLDELRDDAIERRELLRERALRGEVTPVESAPAVEREAEDLMAQLEASLAGVQ